MMNGLDRSSVVVDTMTQVSTGPLMFRDRHFLFLLVMPAFILYSVGLCVSVHAEEFHVQNVLLPNGTSVQAVITGSGKRWNRVRISCLLREQNAPTLGAARSGRHDFRRWVPLKVLFRDPSLGPAPTRRFKRRAMAKCVVKQSLAFPPPPTLTPPPTPSPPAQNCAEPIQEVSCLDPRCNSGPCGAVTQCGNGVCEPGESGLLMNHPERLCLGDCEGTLVSQELPYGDDRKQINVVHNRAQTSMAPVIIVIHGGGFISGHPGSMLKYAELFTQHGFVAFTPTYRLVDSQTGENGFPTQVQDVACAVAQVGTVASQYGGDPSRIFVMGHSAGAYHAAMIAYANEQNWLSGCAAGQVLPSISGFIGSSGLYDFAKVPSEQWNVGCYLQALLPGFTCGEGLSGWRDYDPKAWQPANPISYVSLDDPPAALITGTLDTVVNTEEPVGVFNNNTLGFDAQLRNAQIPSNLKVLEGWEHNTVGAVFANCPADPQSLPECTRYQEMVDFLLEFTRNELSGESCQFDPCQGQSG